VVIKHLHKYEIMMNSVTEWNCQCVFLQSVCSGWMEEEFQVLAPLMVVAFAKIEKMGGACSAYGG
jgi:hypothetical protein